MIDDVENDAVVEELKKFLQGRQNPGLWFKNQVADDQFMEQLGFHESAAEYAEAAVRICIENENARWLASILDGLPSLPHIEKIKQKLVRRPSDTADRYEAVWVQANQLFLNRRTLRAKLKSLSDPKGRRILVIKGPPRCGKSHTAELIQFISEGRPDFRIARLKIPAGAAVGVRPDALARDIVWEFGRKPKDVPQQEPTPMPNRWVRELSAWLLAEAADTQKKWWIVLDGYGGTDLLQDTAKLIDEIAVHATMGEHRKYIRLVLVGHERPLPPEVRPHVEVDELKGLHVFDEEDVRACVRSMFHSAGVEYEPAAVEKIVAKVMAAMSSIKDPLERLLKLTEELQRVYDSIQASKMD